MLLTDFARSSREALSPLYGDREAASVVSALCEDLCGIGRHETLLHPLRELSRDEEALLVPAFERLLKWEPVQYVTGKAWFCGRAFKVAPGVLIPRPETEELVNLARASAVKGSRILDLCTGSGCIAWTLASSIPDSRVTGVDVSPQALALARSQGDASDCSGHCTPDFVEADVLGQDFLETGASFDLIVSNPPYVMNSESRGMMRNVLEWEPGIAIFVGDDDPLLFYEAIARLSLAHLAPEGHGFVEINSLLAKETEAVFRDAGFTRTTLHRDISGRERFVSYAF